MKKIIATLSKEHNWSQDFFVLEAVQQIYLCLGWVHHQIYIYIFFLSYGRVVRVEVWTQSNKKPTGKHRIYH